MSTAFGVIPRFRERPAAPIVKAIDRDAPLRPRRRFSPWTAAEDSVIRERHMHGSAAVMKLIPHRSRKAIWLRARKIGHPIKWVHGVGYKRPSARGNKRMLNGCHPLVKELVRVIEAKQLTWDEVEQVCGVGNGTIRRWASRESYPRLDTFIAALQTVGMDLVITLPERSSPASRSLASPTAGDA